MPELFKRSDSAEEKSGLSEFATLDSVITAKGWSRRLPGPGDPPDSPTPK